MCNCMSPDALPQSLIVPPSLQGGGFSWLFPFQNGAPPIGWHDAICYLILPAALVASQFITQKILSPSTPNDPQAQQTNAILKFLPLMIGEVQSSCLHRDRYHAEVPMSKGQWGGSCLHSTQMPP